jgi:CoA:oxalate CoA-transferase
LNGPLKGIRILDLSHVYFGPYTTMILGSMNADVIKIEPLWGEMARLYPPLIKGESSPFMFLNRNKRGMALNLKSDKGKQIFFKLLEKSDVVVENFKRGTMDKLGLGYDELVKVKPDIIYAALSGFGLDGPYRYRPSFAPVAEAMTGWMRLTGDLIDPEGPPIRPAEYHGDLDPALWAVIAILSALSHRDRTGEGQMLDVSQLDCLITQTGVPISNYLATGKFAWQIWNERPTSGILFGIFKASDGYVYVAAEAGQVDRLKTVVGDELENQEDLARWTNDKTMKFIVEALVKADIPVAPVYQIDAVVEDPHVKARGMITEIEHPRAGRLRQPSFPLKFSKTSMTMKPAPTLGQHNEELLKDLLGFSEEELTKLRQEGVIT